MNKTVLKRNWIRLCSLFVLVAIIALIVALDVSLEQIHRKTPHQQAIDNIWGLDGSAMADSDGLFAIVLCGNSIRVDDRICSDIALCPEVQKLTVTHSQITDRGVKKIASLNNVFYLNLNSNAGVTDLSVPVLCQWAGLRELYISETGISNAGCELLRKSLPNCTIHE